MGGNLASEETGRLRTEMGAGARRVYQRGIFHDLSTKSSHPLSTREFL